VVEERPLEKKIKRPIGGRVLGYGSYFRDSAANPQILVVKAPPNLLPRRLGEIDKACDCNRDHRYCGTKFLLGKVD